MKTETKNAISTLIFGLTLIVWGLLATYAFLCTPSNINAYGYYTDAVDNVLAENIYQNYGVWVSTFYLPLSFLIEPCSEGHSFWYALTMAIIVVVGLRLFLLMIKAIPEGDFEPVRTSSVVTCVVLLCYIVSYVVLAIV